MTIRLIGELDFDLKILGLKPGDIIHGCTYPAKNGAVYFKRTTSAGTYNCVVWQENYKKVK